MNHRVETTTPFLVAPVLGGSSQVVSGYGYHGDRFRPLGLFQKNPSLTGRTVWLMHERLPTTYVGMILQVDGCPGVPNLSAVAKSAHGTFG